MTESTLPYALLLQASIMIKEIGHIEDHPTEELQIVALINKAGTYPNMSKYQLHMVHRELGDKYYEDEIFGSALDHYQIALRLNPKAPVKRKVAAIKKMSQLRYSINADIDTEPDMSFFEERKPEDEFSKRLEWARSEIRKDVKEDDNVYDQKWEDLIARAVAMLPQFYQDAFYKNRGKGNNDLLSIREQDFLRFRAMAKSYIWQEMHKEHDPEIEDMIKKLEEHAQIEERKRIE